MQKPPPLVSGDAIRIVATGSAVNLLALANGTAALRERYGLQVRQDSSVLDALRGHGSDGVKREVVTARRVLSNLRKTMLSIPCGDIHDGLSTLLLDMRSGTMLSLHGPMGSNVHSFSNVARESMFGILSHQVSELTFSSTVSVRHRGKDSVRGNFLRGNLSGHGWVPAEVPESYSVHRGYLRGFLLDRMLTTFLRSEDLSGIVGIAIGRLLDGGHERLRRTGIAGPNSSAPGLPIGHDMATAMPVVPGADTEIDVEDGSLVIAL
ncbi:hypothetical protein F5146DRAFT_1003712 [Armillaria mellea]|nr:hypothetical protein F5146DRAFT_1003712 [Armillaria mellea]